MSAHALNEAAEQERLSLSAEQAEAVNTIAHSGVKHHRVHVRPTSEYQIIAVKSFTSADEPETRLIDIKGEVVVGELLPEVTFVGPADTPTVVLADNIWEWLEEKNAADAKGGAEYERRIGLLRAFVSSGWAVPQTGGWVMTPEEREARRRETEAAHPIVDETMSSGPPPKIRVTCPLNRRTPDDVVGCGHTFTATPDEEGLVDCPECGMWFNPANPNDAASFKAEVETEGNGKWGSNSLRFPTREEAEAYARDLAGRWLLVRDTRVTESDDQPNYTFTNGQPARI